MNSKKWYESKTMWSGILMMIMAIYQIVTTGRIDPQAILAALGGLGLIGLRQAVD